MCIFLLFFFVFFSCGILKSGRDGRLRHRPNKKYQFQKSICTIGKRINDYYNNEKLPYFSFTEKTTSKETKLYTKAVIQW